jgi:hypothetical protein
MGAGAPALEVMSMVSEKPQVNTEWKLCDLCKYLTYCPYSCPDKPPSARSPGEMYSSKQAVFDDVQVMTGLASGQNTHPANLGRDNARTHLPQTSGHH